ncbi:MAG: hypothetical protein EXX96DRAFT_359276 [Benjaminiella poitrasii]|nr:MAG: hypothetical protein EXX96DRAFT_359276 [Benjaminiella poitrasii]
MSVFVEQNQDENESNILYIHLFLSPLLLLFYYLLLTICVQFIVLTDMLTFSLPIDQLPGKDRFSKTIIKTSNVIDLAASDLLGVPKGTYTSVSTEWQNGSCSDVQSPLKKTHKFFNFSFFPAKKKKKKRFFITYFIHFVRYGSENYTKV